MDNTHTQERHLTSLNKLCRTCGRLNITKKQKSVNKRAALCHTLKYDIFLVFGIDIGSDEDDSHSKYICQKCVMTLRSVKGRHSSISLKTARGMSENSKGIWCAYTPHFSSEECSVCQHCISQSTGCIVRQKQRSSNNQAESQKNDEQMPDTTIIATTEQENEMCCSGQSNNLKMSVQPTGSSSRSENHNEEPMDVSESASSDQNSSVKNSKVAEDDDDDVVIMDEESVKNEDVLKTISLNIENIKDIARVTEDEMGRVTKELERMKGDLSESVFQSIRGLFDNPDVMVHLPVDESGLQDMIKASVESLHANGLVDLSKEDFDEMSEKLNSIERANQSVSKLFLDCHSRLKEFKEMVTSEQEDVEKSIKEYEERIEKNPLLIDSDEEDVMVLEPSASVRPKSQTPGKGSQNAAKTTSPRQPQGTVQRQPQTSAIRKSLESPSPYMTSSPRGPAQSSGNAPIPSIEQLRSQFVSAVSKSMPTLMSSLQSQQVSTNLQLPPQAKPVAPLPIKWPELKVMDKVLGKKFNDVWYSGTVLDVYPVSMDESNEWKCKVKFDGKGMKILPGRHVAYREPINCFIRVGTRVVALYKEDDAPNTFFAGVIAEAPSLKNNRRFLVFFDDGYAQYCEAKELHKVYMQSENVWEDINPETSAFIKEYLRIYPERPMVRLSKGQVVRTEWNGKWWTAKVQETDASLVKMYFQADKRTEWIYRGSTRLEPLFKALANADAIKAAGSARGRRHNLNMRPSDAVKPSVEYTRNMGEDDTNTSSTSSTSSSSKPRVSSRQSEPTKKKSNVAKKSTGGAGNPGSGSDTQKSGPWEAPWIRYQRKAPPGTQRSRSVDSAAQDSEKGQSKGSSDSRGNKEKELASSKDKDIASVLQERLAASNPEVEYDEENATGERREMMLDTKDKPRKPYKPHKCNPVCLKECDDDPDKFKGRNTLLIPLLCGWERHVCKARPATRRHVVYRAPCGRRLRTIEEVDKYLLITDSHLTIDFFCFDQQLHVNTEFVPVKTFCDIKDLSYGKENYPISCVNGIDRLYPDYVEYAGHRIPSTGVSLNVDPDFLVCCDCTDNCRDRSKCACQQMTVGNTSWVGEIDPEAGYHHRRLPEPLFTGIVECNSRCKCDQRCSNRVAQQGLRMRLQVFKTEKKGWGLRCLDDISKGSFICIYAGQLLTDKGANEDGKQYGDEYLAELDFIEVVERQKEGYESDVEDMEFSDDETDANYKASKDSEEDSDYAHHGSPPSEVKRDLRRRKKKESEGETSKPKEEEPKKKPETISIISSNTADEAINISDDDNDDEDCEMKSKSEEKMEDKKEVKKEEKKEEKEEEKKEVKESSAMETEEKPETETVKKMKPRAKKSTGGSRFNLSSTTFKMKEESVTETDEKTEKKERIPTRSFFHDDTECYIMDAKSMGNLGRYLNHSCSPNVFVQNIFVDTHDLRFPWVAFFAGQYIRAGTELTWDYNYEVGSVPDKVLYCYCGSPMCRGRLL